MKQALLIALVLGFVASSYSQSTVKILAGANLKAVGGAYIVLRNTSLVNNGALVQAPGDGTVKLTGNTNTTCSGTGTLTLDKLEVAIDNGFADTLKSPVSVKSLVTLTSGQMVSNGNLTLKSDSVTYVTARIAPVVSTVSSPLSGDVIVERFIHSAARRAYRLLGPSVTTSTSIHANWQDGAASWYNNPTPGYGTQITGTTVDQQNGFDWTSTGQASLFTFNPASGWVAISNTNVNTLDAKTGYLVFVRGDRSYDLTQQGATFIHNNTTLRAKGAITTGTVSWTGISGTANANALVTNPYAAPIDWTKIYEDVTTANSTNYLSSIQMWDPSVGTRGGYISVIDLGNGTWTKSGGTSNITKEIQSGEGFFLTVKSGAASPSTFTIKEQHKSTNNNLGVFTPITARSQVDIILSYTDPYLGLITADGVTTIYDNLYCECVDGNDAQNFTNMDEDMAIMRYGQKLSIETRPLLSASDTTPLFMTHMKTQSYWWQFNVKGIFIPGLTAVLVDNYTGARTPVSLADTTVIHFDVDLSIAGSKATNRFYVVYAPQDPLAVIVTGIKAYQYNSGVNVDWSVSQQVNMGSYEVQRATDPGSFTTIGKLSAKATRGAADYSFYDASPAIGTNYYKVKITDLNGIVSYTNVVKVMMGGTPPAITVYPNPVRGNTFTLQLANVKKDNYRITLVNAFGQVIYTRAISFPGGSGTDLISLDRKLPPGLYMLRMGSLSTQIIKE